MKNPIEPNKRVDPLKATIYINWLVEKKFKGLVLDGKYGGARSSFFVKCDNPKHNPFETCWFYLNRNQWCKLCHLESTKNVFRITVADCKALAKKRKWKFLSKTYDGPRKKMLWQCPNGHLRLMSYANFYSGKGCSECAGNSPELAKNNFEIECKKKNIIILKGYKNAYSRVFLKCGACGFKWTPIASTIAQGKHGCRACAASKNSDAKRGSIIGLRKLCKINGFELLSEKYVDSSTQVKIRCKERQHVTYKTPNSIQQGTTCIKCYRESQIGPSMQDARKTIGALKQICKQRNWKLLTNTKTYKGSLKPITITCSCGNTWHPFKSQILTQGMGCPRCSSGAGERLTRVAIEWLTGKPFPKNRRLEVLRYPKTGFILELDGFNEDLMVAFEHQGAQHYRFSDYFHKNRAAFLEGRDRDKFKLAACRKAGISLILVPPVNDEIYQSDLVPFLKSQFNKLGIHYINHAPDASPDWGLAYVPRMKKLNDELRIFLKKNPHIRLLTGKILSANQKNEFFCSKHKNKFIQNIYKLRLGRGCRKCNSEIRQKMIKKM